MRDSHASRGLQNSPFSRSSWRSGGPRLFAVLATGVVLYAAPQGTGSRLSQQDPILDTLPEVLIAEPPLGLGAPADYPWLSTPDLAAWADLGRTLFFDPILSKGGEVSCASCHQPAHGFADPVPLSRGVRGQFTRRHAPILLNRGLGEAFMWDGSANTLEEQVLQPIVNPLEMDETLPSVLAKLNQIPDYARRFTKLTGRTPEADDLAKALAMFIRHLWHGGSAVDRFRAGDVQFLTAEERAGMWVYESRGACWRCHGGVNFTDEAFHNTGVELLEGESVPGRMAVTGLERDRGGFKTPSLRGLTLSAPYMHDGSHATLEEVVAFYQRGGGANSHLDPAMAAIHFSDQDGQHLLAFLRALSRVE